MDIERRPSNYSTLEVMAHSNCLLMAAGLGGFLALAILLGVGIATNMVLSGFSLYIFLLSSAILFVCICVGGWQYNLLKLERDERVKHNRKLDQDIALRVRALNMATKADEQGDNVKMRISDKEVVMEVVRATMNVRQQANRVVEERLPLVLAEPVRSGQGIAQQSPAIILPEKLVIPAPYDLINVMRKFPLSEDNMFLGAGGHKQQITCDPSVELCHGAFNAASGRGKTIMVRGIETQLLKLGYEVVHADIKFSLIDEKGNDYRPIAKALLDQGDLNAGGHVLPHLIMRDDQIYYLLSWLSTHELMRRLAMYNAGDHSYSVFFLFLEELLYLVTLYKDLGPMIGRLLNVGRSLGIKVFCIAQNFQVQNLKLNTGMRENFESAWYLGGDIRSAAAVLDMTVKDLEAFIVEHDIVLGNGVSMFRNNNVAYKAGVLRGGMASNDFVYWMLGKADGFKLPDGILPQVNLERETNRSSKVVGDDRGMVGTGSTSGVIGYSGGPANEQEEVAKNGLISSTVRVTGALQKPVEGLLEPVGNVPDSSPLGSGDMRFTDEQITEFIHLYKRLRNRKECLHRMRNPRTQSGYGLGHRYDKHAQIIVDQYQLDK